MPLNTVARAAFAHVQRQAQQLGAAFHALGSDDLGDAQVDLGEVVDADLGGDASPPGTGASGDHRRRRRLEQGLELLGVHALHQVLVGADGVAERTARASSQAAARTCRKASTCAASAGSTGLR
jgi:hypothetical protein